MKIKPAHSLPLAQKPARPPKPATGRLEIRLPIALHSAANKAAVANDETLGALVRRAIASEIGKPELATTIGRGERGPDREKRKPRDKAD